MIASFDATIAKHEETVRRAEERYALLQALRESESETATDNTKPRRRLSALLRRIAGSPAAA